MATNMEGKTLTRQIVRLVSFPSIPKKRFLFFCHLRLLLCVTLFYIRRLQEIEVGLPSSWQKRNTNQKCTQVVYASLTCDDRLLLETNRFSKGLHFCVWWMVILKDLGQREPWTYLRPLLMALSSTSIVIKMGETKLFFSASHPYLSCERSPNKDCCNHCSQN